MLGVHRTWHGERFLSFPMPTVTRKEVCNSGHVVQFSVYHEGRFIRFNFHGEDLITAWWLMDQIPKYKGGIIIRTTCSGLQNGHVIIPAHPLFSLKDVVIPPTWQGILWPYKVFEIHFQWNA